MANYGHTLEESAVAFHERSEVAGKLDEEWHMKAGGAPIFSDAEQLIFQNAYKSQKEDP